jgi:hypothetical protein
MKTATITFAEACELLDALFGMHRLRGRYVRVFTPLTQTRSGWMIQLECSEGDLPTPRVFQYKLAAGCREWGRVGR